MQKTAKTWRYAAMSLFGVCALLFFLDGEARAAMFPFAPPCTGELAETPDVLPGQHTPINMARLAWAQESLSGEWVESKRKKRLPSPVHMHLDALTPPERDCEELPDAGACWCHKSLPWAFLPSFRGFVFYPLPPPYAFSCFSA